MFSIMETDMHLRDQRVLDWIQKQGHDEMQIKASTIADVFKCHENTARAILKRLKSAKKITVVARTYRGGFIYRVM